MKILFLDDDSLRHAHAAQALIGHDVRHVRTVAEALECLRAERYDLALLDHDLGGTHYAPSDEKSGYAVTEAIANGDVPPPPFVIVHSYNAPGARRMVMALEGASIRCAWTPFGPGEFALVQKLSEAA